MARFNPLVTCDIREDTWSPTHFVNGNCLATQPHAWPCRANRSCFLLSMVRRSLIPILAVFKNFQIKERMKLQLRAQSLSATPASPSAVDRKDDKQPYTDGWSVNVDQATPWQGLFELSYVGNRSRDLQNTQGGAGSNINLVPAGSMLSATNPATANADTYRPLQGYQNLNLATNNLYQNYNAMQVSWARHAGHVCHPNQLHISEGFGRS